MSAPRAIPALADLTQVSAGPLPLRLLHDWASGRRDLAAARALPEAFEIRGTVVASDTSGLSRLTRERDLLDVLRLVSRPQEIVHAVGRAIGGRAVGRWVADNTLMYYPPAVPIPRLLAALVETLHRIRARSPVSVGMCAHPGVFYEIGGVLYGPDAELVDSLAEHAAGPEEILLTGEAAAGLDPALFPVRPRQDLRAPGAPAVFTLVTGPRLPDLVATDIRYPHPYTDEFFEMLLALDAGTPAPADPAALGARYAREAAVVFVARERRPRPVPDLAALLDDLTGNALVDAIVRRAPGGGATLVQSTGGCAVLTFAGVAEALEWSRQVRARAGESGIPVRVGIDAGRIFLFEREDGSVGIAGDPVNTASKISEDAGEVGAISLTARAAARLPALPAGEPFRLTVSNVLITGLRL